MLRQFTLIILLALILASCTRSSKNLSIKITHYGGGSGITLIYDLDQEGLQVTTNCDLENCKERTVYQRTFTKSQRDSIFMFINSLQLDSLQSSYETKGIMDGLFTTLTIKQGFFSKRTSTFNNFSTPATDTLFRYIDNLILIKKYRFYSWGSKG